MVRGYPTPSTFLLKKEDLNKYILEDIMDAGYSERDIASVYRDIKLHLLDEHGVDLF